MPYLKLGDTELVTRVRTPKPWLNLNLNVYIQHYSSPKTPAEFVQARYDILSSLPIPSGIPDDVLNPIIIPSPVTIHEFLGNTIGVRFVRLLNDAQGLIINEISHLETRNFTDNYFKGVILTYLQ